MSDFQGKSIIVTGGGSGIGAAAALLGASRGARVTVADINEAGGEAVVAKITGEGGSAQFVRTDISNEDQVMAMVTTARTAFGNLHGAFNNAGIPNGTMTLFADLPVATFRKGLDVNIVGTFLCMKYEIAAMLESGGGAIVNTSSCAGILAVGGAADYVTGKHGVIGLTKSAALDYATTGIRVNAVLPGVIRTPMLEVAFEVNPELVEWASTVQPNKRMGRPEEVAEAALWLLSDAASLVTGISMPIDGGFTMV